jgi:hypothetical protein
MYNYHNKIFRAAANSSNGEVNGETIFEYTQLGNIVTAVYQGGTIIKGSLIALVDDEGKLDMRYQHVNNKYQLMTGTCTSTPEMMPNGKLKLHEQWQWTCGDESKGASIIEEL